MKIAIDLDDTLSVIDRVSLSQTYIARNKLPFKLVNPDAHKLVDVFDWTIDDVMTFVHRHGGLTMFLEAKARKGARETLARLRAEGHEITVLTARGSDWFANPEKLSRDWLEKRKIPYDNLVTEIPMNKKGEYCAHHGIPVLIDDNASACIEAQNLGVHAVLFLGKHNRTHAHEVAFGGASWTAVDAVLKRIEKISRLEELTETCCPAKQSSNLDGWEIRFDDTSAPRGNHVRAMLPSLMDFEGKLALCESCYSAENKPCRFRITPLDRALEQTLVRRGYRKEQEVDCFLMNPIFPFSRPKSVVEEPYEKWRKNYCSITGESALRSLDGVSGECVFVAEYDGETPVSVGMCVIDKGAVGIFDVRVRESYRRNGYGTRIVQTLLVEGKRSGAEYAYLQAPVLNLAGHALYDAFHFAKAYTYCYYSLSQEE